jgi:hypothetical protein
MKAAETRECVSVGGGRTIGKLMPLGDPAPNAPKWFAAVEVIRLATDKDWLHKATKEISKYWRNKRGRRQSPLAPLPRSTACRT